MELLASVRPRSVAVSFGFFVLGGTVDNAVGFRFASATLVLLLGPEGVSSVGNSGFSEEILNFVCLRRT